MGQEVISIDPFGDGTGSLNPMEVIEPTSQEAFEQSKRIAALIRRTTGGDYSGPFWDDISESLITGSILCLATHIRPKDLDLSLLYRMWGVADQLDDMLACMHSCNLHGDAMAAAAKAYTDALERPAASILTTLRRHIGLASAGARAGLRGGRGLLQRIREAHPMTIPEDHSTSFGKPEARFETLDRLHPLDHRGTQRKACHSGPLSGR